ncbi:hypothetical protein CVT24_008222, partial [Panaeolus cyanescens]
TQQSIQKVVAFAIKYYGPCGDDLWDCIIEAAEKGSINSRMNLLHFLDSLCETSLIMKLHAEQLGKAGESEKTNGLYVFNLSRDLNRIVDYIVPEGKEGLPNLVSTKQILETWRHKRYIDTHKIDEVITSLDQRPSPISLESSDTQPAPTNHVSQSRQAKREHRDSINERIEQDRERHKRLRERRWVQPTYRNPVSMQIGQLACFQPLDTQEDMERALDIEFENDWETTSDWNPDDEDAIREDTYLAYLGDPK